MAFKPYWAGVLFGIAAFAAQAQTSPRIKSAVNVAVWNWGAGSNGYSFIHMDPAIAVDCAQGWIRIADANMLAQILQARAEERVIDYMVYRTDADPKSARYDMLTTCVVEWIEFK